MNNVEIKKAIYTIEHFQELIGDYETREHIEDLIDSIDLAIEALEKQLNGGWILCNEKLPDDIPPDNNFGVDYWITYLDEYNNPAVGVYEWLWNRKWNIIHKVIAWQPLPKEYKELS